MIRKADEIREDLGSANELFDEAAHRRLVEGESIEAVQADLDRRVAAARGRAAIDADDSIETATEGRAAGDQLAALAAEIDLDPRSIRDTLEAAMAIRVGRPQLDCSMTEETCKILNPALPGWSEIIDESLRRVTGRSSRGPVARVAFSPKPFLQDVGGREVFCPRPDVFLMHLSHPMLQRALSALIRRRFPGTGDEVSRWTVRLGEVPTGHDALVLLSIEELALNDLRETFHHWVRTLIFPVRQGALERELESAGVRARKLEEERYRSRQGEVSSLIAENSLAKLEREIAKLKAERQQGLLFDETARLDAIDRSIEEKQEEIARRTRHYEEVRAQLDRERDRVLRNLLPKRHSLAGAAQVFPVSIEVRLPGGTS